MEGMRNDGAVGRLYACMYSRMVATRSFATGGEAWRGVASGVAGVLAPTCAVGQ